MQSTHVMCSLEKIYNDLCILFGAADSSQRQKQGPQSLTSQPSHTISQYAKLTVEVTEEHEELDTDDVEEVVQSADLASMPHLLTHDVTEIHIVDDGLSKALEVMAAVQASSSAQVEKVLANTISECKTSVRPSMATGLLLERARFRFSSLQS